MVPSVAPVCHVHHTPLRTGVFTTHLFDTPSSASSSTFSERDTALGGASVVFDDPSPSSVQFPAALRREGFAAKGQDNAHEALSVTRPSTHNGCGQECGHAARPLRLLPLTYRRPAVTLARKMHHPIHQREQVRVGRQTTLLCTSKPQVCREFKTHNEPHQRQRAPPSLPARTL